MQHDFYKINCLISDDFEKVCAALDLEFNECKNMRQGCCPGHDGENRTAFALKRKEDYDYGVWCCFTRQCHKKFGSSPLGFLRGVFDKRGVTNENSIIEWLYKILEVDVNILRSSSELREDRTLTKFIDLDAPIPQSFEITSAQFISRLKLPAEYYVKRGFSPKVLNEYCVGTCFEKSKPMYSRVVIPIYNLNGSKVIACSGRSMWEKCKFCNCYHNPEGMCPTKDYKRIYSKWRHSVNLPSEYALYNYSKAVEPITQSGLVFMVEGFPNVWRLKEAGFGNVLAAMGTKFSYYQKNLLDRLALSTIVIIPDADEPSKLFVEAVKSLCENSYNIHIVEPQYEDDIGACQPTEVQRILTNWS